MKKLYFILYNGPLCAKVRSVFLIEMSTAKDKESEGTTDSNDCAISKLFLLYHMSTTVKIILEVPHISLAVYVTQKILDFENKNRNGFEKNP